MNIFLHGLMGIHVKPSGIDILIPDVGSDHAYRYGEFLGEVTLAPSTASYHVSGLDKGTVSAFNPAEHIVAGGIALCDQPNLYATICLPPPAVIYSVLKVDLSGLLEDPLNHIVSSSGPNIATLIPVLAYTFQDPHKILFGCEPLNVAPILGSDGVWYVNLHIFAEEDFERDDQHSLDGFDAVAGLFDFPCAPKLASLSNVRAPLIPENLPPGTTSLEFTSLALRTRESGYLGRILRREVLHNHPPMILHLSPLGSNPASCLQLISQ
jgi:hypothetical protein